MYKIFNNKESLPSDAIIMTFIVKDKAAAEEMLAVSYDKVAVAFYAAPKEESEEAVGVAEKVQKLEEQVAKYIEENSVRKFQAKNIGCRVCGSSIAKDYLKSDVCPVCGNDLRSASTIEGETQRRKKLQDAKEALELQRYIDIIKNNEVLWLMREADSYNEHECECGCPSL